MSDSIDNPDKTSMIDSVLKNNSVNDNYLAGLVKKKSAYDLYPELEELRKKVLSLDSVDVKIEVDNNDSSLIPVYSHESDSGVDLKSTEVIILQSSQKPVLVDTGIKVSFPSGYDLSLRGRSGINAKSFIDTKLGTIDSGYRGKIKACLYLNDRLNEVPGLYDIKGKKIDLSFIKDIYDNDQLDDDTILMIDTLINTLDLHGKTGRYSDNHPELQLLDYLDHYAVTVIMPGDRIAQLVLTKLVKMNFIQVDDINADGESDRGSNGFGSTGI